VQTRRLSNAITFYWDNLFCAQTYKGHDLHMTRSRGVIDHVTNRVAIGHFLLVVHWYQVSISKRFRDIRPQKPARKHWHTPQVILYSVPCNALHWTDKYVEIWSPNHQKLGPLRPYSCQCLLWVTICKSVQLLLADAGWWVQQIVSVSQWSACGAHHVTNHRSLS